jgi:hypothetical protein
MWEIGWNFLNTGGIITLFKNCGLSLKGGKIIQTVTQSFYWNFQLCPFKNRCLLSQLHQNRSNKKFQNFKKKIWNRYCFLGKIVPSTMIFLRVPENRIPGSSWYQHPWGNSCSPSWSRPMKNLCPHWTSQSGKLSCWIPGILHHIVSKGDRNKG